VLVGVGMAGMVCRCHEGEAKHPQGGGAEGQRSRRLSETPSGGRERVSVDRCGELGW